MSRTSASKFAVEGRTLSLALEVKQFGLRLTIVEPGFFRTSLGCRERQLRQKFHRRLCA